MSRFYFEMTTSFKLLLFPSVLVSLFVLSSAQSCLKYKFAENKNFNYCNDLPYLNSCIHYTYNATDGSLEFAYRHTAITKPGTTWVAWAINLVGTGMENANTFVAFPKADGSMNAYTTMLLGLKPSMLAYDIMLKYSNLSATYANNDVVIFATVILPDNRTTINHIWQEGPLSFDNPGMHDTALPNMMSRGTLDVLSGQATFYRTIPINNVQRKKNLHATFNVVGWGIMMPLGTMLARYLKVIESAEDIWLYIHITWQTIAYIVGVTGWALGIKIGSTIHQGKNQMHRALGYTLFSLATLQVLAFFVRPKKDNKYRFYWTIYHKVVGHGIVIIAIINVFKGFIILSPTHKWMREYSGTLSVLILVGIFLEFYTQKLIQERNQMIRVTKQPDIQLGYTAPDGYEGRDRYRI